MSERKAFYLSGTDWRRHARVLAAYLALSLALTWPLAAHLTTHIPGSNVDESAFVWNIWWVKYALVDLHSNPLVTDYLFYPLGLNLTYYTLTLLNGVLAAPFLLVLDAIIVNNLLYLFSFTLSGWGAYLLARYLLGRDESALEPGTREAAALVAGLIFAFGAPRFVYGSLGQFNFVSIHWLPFYALYLVKTLDGPRRRNPVLAALFLLAAGYTEFTFLVFLALLTAVYVPVRTWPRVLAWARARRWGDVDRAWFGRMALLGGVFLAGFTPIFAAMAAESRAQGDYLMAGWGGAERFSADLISFLLPTALHPVFGPAAKRAASAFTDLNVTFLGWATLLLAVAGTVWLWRRREIRAWFWAGLAAWVLTLGPLLHLNGRMVFDLDGIPASIPLPFIALHYLPLLNAARVPNRFVLLLMLALAVLAAFGLAHLLRRLPAGGSRYALAALVAALVLFEHLSAPLPLVYSQPPRIYGEIAKDPGDFAVLQAPLGWRNGFGTLGRESTLLQSYQSVHHKRILGGNTSRNPAFKFDYFKRLPVVRSLIVLEEGKPADPAVLAEDKALAAETLRFLGVRYVVVHPPFTRTPVHDYLTQTLPLQPIYDEENVAGYRVALEGGGDTGAVDFGTPAAWIYLGEGWSWNEGGPGGASINWAAGTRAWLMLRVDEPADARLSFRALPYAYPDSPQQTVAVAVNGRKLETFLLEAAWNDLGVDMPRDALRAGINEVSFEFAYTASPAHIEGSTDKRELAAAFDTLRLEPR